MPGIFTLFVGIAIVATYRPALDAAGPGGAAAWAVAAVALALYPALAWAAGRAATAGLGWLRRLVRRRAGAPGGLLPEAVAVRLDRPGLRRVAARLQQWPLAVAFGLLGGAWLVLIGGLAALLHGLAWPLVAARAVAGSAPPDALVEAFGLLPLLPAIVARGVGMRRLEVASDGDAPPGRLETAARETRQLLVPLLPAALAYGGFELLASVDALRELVHLHPSLPFALAVVALPVPFALAPIVVRSFFPSEPVEGPIRERLEALAGAAGTRCRDFLVWRVGAAPLLTAAVSGLVARWRYVCVTDALLARLSWPQLEAVVAHELGHVRRRHMALFMAYVALLVALLGIGFSLETTPQTVALALRATDSAERTAAAAPADASALAGVTDALPSAAEALGLGVLAAILLAWLAVLGWISRQIECDADREGARLVGSPEPLAAALHICVRAAGASPRRRSWRYPSVERRVALLREMFDDPDAERRFVRRIGRIRTVVVGLVLALSGLLLAAVWEQARRPTDEKLLVAAWLVGEAARDGGGASEEVADYLRRSIAIRDSAVARILLADLERRRGEPDRARAQVEAASRALDREPLAPVDRVRSGELRALCRRWLGRVEGD